VTYIQRIRDQVKRREEVMKTKDERKRRQERSINRLAVREEEPNDNEKRDI